MVSRFFLSLKLYSEVRAVILGAALCSKKIIGTKNPCISPDTLHFFPFSIQDYCFILLVSRRRNLRLSLLGVMRIYLQVVVELVVEIIAVAVVAAVIVAPKRVETRL